MTHGKQLRPISDLESERWYTPDCISTQPTWYKNNDGNLLVIQYLCDPYLTYIRSYSKNCIAIQLNSELLFGDLDKIYVSIMDNGVGISPEKLSTLLTTDSSGYGLKNVHDRLLLAYGKGSGLTINSILGQSTMITFMIPMN